MDNEAKIRIPASTSNLGPGFDCLGLALNIYNTATVSRSERGFSPTGMMAETGTFFFKHAAGGSIAPFPFRVKIEGDIPISRGLGSSVTVRLGVLMGLAELARESVTIPGEEILRLLIELEGHPDNAVPSFHGGFAVSSPASANRSDGFAYTRAEVGEELSFVAFIPEMRLSTEKARGLLPASVPLKHAVENAQRTARIATSFCLRDYAALRGLFVDHLHEPFRQVLIPGFQEILAAGVQAGALGSFLSGAGSTLMAVTLERVEEISAAMAAAAQRHQLPGKIRVLKADNRGAQVIPNS